MSARFDSLGAPDESRGTLTDARFAYVLADDQMAQGSTLGAPRCCLVMKPTGAIEHVYSSDVGNDLFGAIAVRMWDRRSKVRLSSRNSEFRLHPERQEHRYDLDNGVSVLEQAFPYNYDGEDGTSVPAPAVYYRFRFRNHGTSPAAFNAFAFAELRGNTSQDVVAEFDAELGGIVAWNRLNPGHVRLFGALGEIDAWETSDDRGKIVARTAPEELANATASVGPDPIGALRVAIDLAPGAEQWVEFLCVMSATSREDLVTARASCPDGATAAARTSAYYWKYLRKSVVSTPDRNVNQGVLWAKADMLRVQTYAPTGWCFTNDPTRSNNSVGRDTAWMTYGADYVNPDFARESLAAYFRLQEPCGKIVEYYDIRNDKSEDYGLNVNDNTPLAVLALWHHYAVTGNEAFLRSCYDGATRAMAYMLSQRDERGLIWCTSTKTSDWGIVGWRNVIQNYRISGASTEVNSECYAALRALANASRLLGDAAGGDAHDASAGELRTAIEKHLVNPANGLYYLTIDVDGVPRTDVTSDLVFPILFGVAGAERAARIIGVLSDAAFWTDGGIRTVPRDDLTYGPTNGYGLLGGVWVAATFWYAFAAARFNPTFMAKALSTSFRHFSSDPRRNNTVPGQFSEWLHGEILVNQGMMLSPWDAPRYLWAAIEGAAGLDVRGQEARITPSLAADWRWLAATNVPFRGTEIAWLALRMPEGLTVLTTSTLGSDARLEAYDRDVTEKISVSDPLTTVTAFVRGAQTTAFIGHAGAQAITIAASFLELAGIAYAVRFFSTLWNEWRELGTLPSAHLRGGIIVVIDAGGFALIEATEA